MSLPQFIQFGNSPIPGRLSDQLQHYRLEINKLQRINMHQKQGYQKKIAKLQQTIKQGGINSAHNRNYIPSYTPASDINNQIVKRDRQINRLSQQNQRLRRNYVSNPDTQLIKRRQIFDQVADKDTQIMKLKKTIYELQAKYDGKYFNDTRMRNQYDLLLQENKKLRKQMQINYNNMQNKRLSNQVSNQLLEGIRYKKQYDLMLRQNQLLKNQYKRLNDQAQSYRQLQVGRFNSTADLDILRNQLFQSNRRNQQLIQNLRRYENENNMLRTQGSYVAPAAVYGHQQYASNIKQQPYKVNNAQTLPNSPQRHRRPNIFKSEGRNSQHYSQQNSPYNLQQQQHVQQNVQQQNVQQQNVQVQQNIQNNMQYSTYSPSPYPLMAHYQQKLPMQPKRDSYPQMQHYQQKNVQLVQPPQQQYPNLQQPQPQQQYQPPPQPQLQPQQPAPQQPSPPLQNVPAQHMNQYSNQVQQKPSLSSQSQQPSHINANLMDYRRQDQSRISNSSYAPSQRVPPKIQQNTIPPPINPLPPLPPQPTQIQPLNIQTQRQPIIRQESNQFYYEQLGTPLSRQQQQQLRKFTKNSQERDSASENNSRNGQIINHQPIMQEGNQPKMEKQSSGSMPDHAPKTEKKRSLYEKFNIDQVTKNVVMELPKLAGQTTQQ